MLRFGNEPYLECSSKGYQAFSAFYARLRAYNNDSIESLYQGFKQFVCDECKGDGVARHPKDEEMMIDDPCEHCCGAGRIDGLTWREAKGRTPLNIEACKGFYDFLWKQYFYENPHLIDIIYESEGFSDIFGQEGHQCQAEVMWRIKTGELPLFTSVVNLRKHKFDVYCGRAGKGNDGYFGNPHPVNSKCSICKIVHKKGEAVEKFKDWFYNRIETNNEYRDRVLGLRGKRLGCFCKQLPNDDTSCHCDVYVEFINNYFNEGPINVS